LWRPAHTHVVAAAVVLQVTVDALARAALVVADVLGQLVAGPPFGAGLGPGRRLAATARIGVDDRHMPERAALIPNFRRVIGAVHQVVEIGDTARRVGRQRDRRL